MIKNEDIIKEFPTIDLLTSKPYLIGVIYIKEAIKIIKEKPAALYSIVESVYIGIANKYNVTSASVEKNIRTARQYFNLTLYPKENNKVFLYHLYKIVA